jgi:hypothetical protein
MVGHYVLGESLFLLPQVANERLPWHTQGEAILPVDAGMELDVYRFPGDSVIVSRLLGQNTGDV